MAPFIGCVLYKDEVFAITYTGEIWRLWVDGRQLLLEQLTGNEAEYRRVISLLRSYKDLYQ